jgi:hypothetical protein
MDSIETVGATAGKQAVALYRSREREGTHDSSKNICHREREDSAARQPTQFCSECCRRV